MKPPTMAIRHGKKRCRLRAGRRGTLGAQSGQSFIELALVLPFLLVLAIGVIELGRYAYISILVGNAARAGSAYGAQSLPQASPGNGLAICEAASNDFQGSVVACTGFNGSYQSTGPNGTLNVTISNTCGCDSGGTVTTAGCTSDVNPTAGTCAAGHWVVMINVNASGTFNSLFNYPGIPTSITVSRTSTMRVAEVG